MSRKSVFSDRQFFRPSELEDALARGMLHENEFFFRAKIAWCFGSKAQAKERSAGRVPAEYDADDGDF
jgi:hypothetical protein